jgi:6-pyruvoyltetrahydropterin/6-carboxytetrahydropterin synthase
MFRIVVKKEDMGFDAAHFISFGGKCERLHGHNYRVSVALEGSLTPDRYVFDFVELKSIVRGICKPLDHYFLLPEKSETLQIRRLEREWEIRFQDRRYLLPEQDVVALPVDNITAERLAEHLCGEIVAALGRPHPGNLTAVEVGVEEAPGQTAFYRHSFQ